MYDISHVLGAHAPSGITNIAHRVCRLFPDEIQRALNGICEYCSNE